MLTGMQRTHNDLLRKPDRKTRDIVLSIIFFMACVSGLLLGAFQQYTSYLALIFLMCAAASFFSDYFYLYVALFMFVRHRMILSTIPAFELYACMMLVKFVLDSRKLKIRLSFLPLLSVLVIHTVFAASQVDLRVALTTLLNLFVVYVTLMKVLADDDLMRKFLFAFMMGAVISGVYGYTATDTVFDMRVAGAGVEEVDRNFGILYDPNFASMFYVAAIYIALFLKGLPKIVKLGFAAFFFVLLLETASLSGMLTFAIAGVLAMLLKYRTKGMLLLLAAAAACGLLLCIPQVREIQAVSNLLLRIAERLHYIRIGRWDMFTTGRMDIWDTALGMFNAKPLLGKLFGGSVITVNLTGTMVTAFFASCHQSVIQGMLNFGIIGTLIIFLSWGSVFFYRMLRHMLRPAGYANEDIKILQMVITFVFFVISMTIDSFVDWPSMLLMMI